MRISQNEARALKRRVKQLEDERKLLHADWIGEYPSWKVVGRASVPTATHAGVRVARLLGHPVIAVEQGEEIAFFAVNIETV